MLSKDGVQGMPKRLIPTGSCWCGCGDETLRGSFFLAGHDRRAESDVILVEYENVVGFLDRHGYGPGGKNARKAAEAVRRRGDTSR